jgi:hypothetical protein
MNFHGRPLSYSGLTKNTSNLKFYVTEITFLPLLREEKGIGCFAFK